MDMKDIYKMQMIIINTYYNNNNNNNSQCDLAYAGFGEIRK